MCELSLRIFYPMYRNVADAQIDFDAMRLWARKPNSRSWGIHPDTERPHFIHHNNLALRQHRNFSAADLASATNIGFFGDSFTENYYLPVQYSFTEPLFYLLNQGQKRFHVLNFGVSAYGTGQSFLHYENFRHAEDLDHVVYMYCENDLTEIFLTKLFHLDDAERLVLNEAIRPSWYAPLISWAHLSYLFLHVSGLFFSMEDYDIVSASRKLDKERRKRVNLTGKSLSDKNREASLAIFSQIIRRWKHLVENEGGTFSVVLLPTRPEYPDVLPLLLEENVNVLNLYDCFGDHDAAHRQRPWLRSPYRLRDGHWNEQGNKLAAVCLYRFLEEEVGAPDISEDEMQEALFRYYAAFEEGLPVHVGRQWGEGTRAPVSLQTLTRIRATILAFGASDPVGIKEKMRLKGKRIAHSVFDVYLIGRELLYVKEDCSPADLQATFMLHVFPVDKRSLPMGRKEHGFDNLDFDHPSIKTDEKSCALIQWLPSYAFKRIRTGQYRPDGTQIWSAEIAVE